MTWRTTCAAIAMATALGQAQDGFDLRVSPNARIETLEFIASIAQPRTETVPASTPLKELLRRYYGAALDSFAQLFREYNPGFGKSREGTTTITIPVLPKWSFAPMVLRPAPQNTVQQVLFFFLGYAGKNTYQQVAALNPGVDVKLYEAATGLLRIPYTTGSFLVELKPELRAKAKEIYNQLLALRSKGQILRVDQASRFRAPYQFEAADAPATAGPAAKVDPIWAFRGLGPDALGMKKNTVTIAIADSGIDLESPGHPDARFVYWQGSPPGIGARPEPGEPTCGDIRIGCNFVSHLKFPLDDTDQGDCPHRLDHPDQGDCPHRYHGTHVSGIAFARSDQQLKSYLDDRLNLMVLKVMDKDGRADSDKIASAIQFANEKNVQVVNLSISGPRSTVVEYFIKRSSPQLFVIAAGNQIKGTGAEGLDLDALDPEDETVGFPARFTGDFPNVITVAAHDEAGNLATFSHWGPNTVTMAAPGVHIRSTAPGTDNLELSGTSQAAPMVSLAAALLMASGLDKTPAAIKHRLIASVDVTDALRDKVQAHGKLNIARALAWNFDTIKLRGRDEPLKGSICSPSGLSMPDRNRVEWKYVSKIVLNYSPDDKRRHYVMLRKGSYGFEQWIGDLDLSVFSEIGFAPGQSDCSTAQPIQTTEIADITTRSY